MTYKISLFILYALVSTITGAIEWYSSGPGGHLGEKIQEGGKANMNWTLSIQKDNDMETRKLYNKDKEFMSFLLQSKDGYLQSWEERNQDGELISRIEYKYDAEGNPWTTHRIENDSETTETRVENLANAYANGTNLRHVYGEKGNWTIVELDRFGKALKQSVYKEEEEETKTTWKRTETGQLLESQTTDNQQVRLSQYDTKERLIFEQVSQDEIVILTQSYEWDDDDNLIHKEKRGEGSVQEWSNEWQDGKKIREQFFVNGVLDKETIWPKPNEKIETLYNKGKPIIRRYEVDSRKKKEEYLLDDEVVRVREF